MKLIVNRILYLALLSIKDLGYYIRVFHLIYCYYYYYYFYDYYDYDYDYYYYYYYYYNYYYCYFTRAPYTVPTVSVLGTELNASIIPVCALSIFLVLSTKHHIFLTKWNHNDFLEFLSQ